MQNYRISVLQDDTLIKPFDCGDNDLNEFLFNDAKNYRNSLLAITYLMENDEDTIGYFTLLHDKIERTENSKWNKVNREINNNKRRRTYPAIKIGRLAISKKYKGMRYGNLIIKSVIRNYLLEANPSAGCRFVTVDAYANAVEFYQKNGFHLLTDKDANENTRTMFFDILTM